MPYSEKASSCQGAYRLPLFNCVSVCVCVTFVVSADCESCTRPISTNPGSIKAGEYGVTRRIWFTAHYFDVVAHVRVAVLNLVLCLGCGGTFSCFFFIIFSSYAHGLLQVCDRLASYTSLLVMRQDRGGEASQNVFGL